MKIDIPELLLHLRSEIKEGSAQNSPVERKLLERLVFSAYASACSRRWSYELGTKLARFFQRPAVRDGHIGKVGGLIAKIAPPLGSWTAWRDAKPIAPRSFRDEWRDRQH